MPDFPGCTIKRLEIHSMPNLQLQNGPFPKLTPLNSQKRIIFAGKLEVEKYWSWLKYDDEIWWNMMKFQFGLCIFETKNLIEQESNRKNDAKRSRRRRRRHCHRKNLRTFRTKSIFQDQYSAIFVGTEQQRLGLPIDPRDKLSHG